MKAYCQGCLGVREVQSPAGPLCRSCAGKKKPLRNLPKDLTSHFCEVCDREYVGKASACSAKCVRMLRKAKDPYFGNNLMGSEGIKDRICQLCFKSISQKAAMHPHHVLGQKRDADYIVALHGREHLVISYLAEMKGLDDKFFERLIAFVCAQATGVMPDVRVDIASYPEDS